MEGRNKMSILSTLDYQTPVSYDESLKYNGKKQFITLRKSKQLNTKNDYYYLDLYYEKNPLEIARQGYIYFYVDFDTKESMFVGVYVKPEFRNLGLASLLVSSWIQICLNNNIDFLKTIKKQRKPFMIYLLKRFGFEIRNPEVYDTDNRVVCICQKEEDYAKYLYFRDEYEKRSFEGSNIMREDNYSILDELGTDTNVLDQVILRKSLSASDSNETFKQAQEKYNQYKQK